MSRHIQIRIAALLASALASIAAVMLFIDFAEPGGLDGIDWLRIVLTATTGFWLVWGSAAAFLGIWVPAHSRSGDELVREPDGMSVILVPIYNEDTVATFSRVAAMNQSLRAIGMAHKFHFAILSDTTQDEILTRERYWFERLLAEPDAPGRVFYRHRKANVGKKAGNIEDFISRSGGAYDYALILDADSLMEGKTIAEMACRLDDTPDLGLLQTLPKIINARSLFGRAIQFSAAYLSPIFARGSALMQGWEGPFWGHNAIVRVDAFAASCGLPMLSGKPPAGGHILSHDYVEAALLSRAGWTVRLDTDLEGSYEEGPENLIAYAKRDRRWCQGNLQHRRILFAPGLKFWNRFTFLQGIMAYLASPLWLLLLAASIVSAAQPQKVFVDTQELASGAKAAWGLVIGITALLIAPKLLILTRGALTGENKKFGGTFRAALSSGAEIVLSTLIAPIMLLLQTRSVFQVLLGLDGGWPATQRDESRVTVSEAWVATWWIVAFGAATLAVVLALSPRIVLWVLPAIVPMMIAPLLIASSSRSKQAGHLPELFRAPLEVNPTPVMLERDRVLARWSTVNSEASAATAPQKETADAGA